MANPFKNSTEGHGEAPTIPMGDMDRIMDAYWESREFDYRCDFMTEMVDNGLDFFLPPESDCGLLV